MLRLIKLCPKKSIIININNIVNVDIYESVSLWGSTKYRVEINMPYGAFFWSDKYSDLSFVLQQIENVESQIKKYEKEYNELQKLLKDF